MADWPGVKDRRWAEMEAGRWFQWTAPGEASRETWKQTDDPYAAAWRAVATLGEGRGSTVIEAPWQSAYNDRHAVGGLELTMAGSAPTHPEQDARKGRGRSTAGGVIRPRSEAQVAGLERHGGAGFPCRGRRRVRKSMAGTDNIWTYPMAMIDSAPTI